MPRSNHWGHWGNALQWVSIAQFLLSRGIGKYHFACDWGLRGGLDRWALWWVRCRLSFSDQPGCPQLVTVWHTYVQICIPHLYLSTTFWKETPFVSSTLALQFCCSHIFFIYRRHVLDDWHRSKEIHSGSRGLPWTRVSKWKFLYHEETPVTHHHRHRTQPAFCWHICTGREGTLIFS